jgi:hypothetical protein
VRLRTLLFHNGVTLEMYVYRRDGASRHRINAKRSDCSFELTDSDNEATATITLPHRSRRLRRAFSAFWCDWFLRGRKRTFSPFNSRVITTYTLKISAAGDGDNRGHTFPAFQAVRRSIHWTLPILPQTRKPERLFHQYITSTVAAVLACDHFFAARDQAGCLTPAESRPFALARANEVG